MVIAIGSAAVYFLYPLSINTSVQAKAAVAIVDGLQEFDPNPQFEETAIKYLAEAGMAVDVYNSSLISVDFMKSFPAGYALIVFRTHSATSRHGVFYFTSESYDETKYQPEQLRDELRPARDLEGHAEVFAFGAKFVDTYLKNRFQNSVIIGMGCFGAGTSYGTEEEITMGDASVEREPNLADAFQHQGALAVIGWDKLVSLSFSDRVTLRLIKALAVDRLSVRRAVEATVRELGPDPVYGSVMVFYPERAGDRVLRIQAPEVNSQSVLVALAKIRHDKKR
jgi:hypothetical protein